MKVYLDTNGVSSIAREDNKAESEAIARLLEALRQGKVELVTSPVTLDEIKKVPPEHYARQERTYRQLGEVPLVPWDQLQYITQSSNDYQGGTLYENRSVIEDDPTYKQLLASGLEVIDARHLFVAAKQGCNVFVTCDDSRGSSILRRAPEIERLTGMVVRRPSGFLEAYGL